MSSNKLSHLLESSNVDWSNVIVTLDQHTNLEYTFPITPKMFLKYAENDLKLGNTHGYVNAISNAKRAMDCQVATIISALGYDFNKLRDQLGKNLSKKIEVEFSSNSFPFEYRFLESLGIFNPVIVSRVRRLRHGVEHKFQKPNKKVAIESHEIATLFILATESLKLNFQESFSFGSDSDDANRGGIIHLKKCFYVQINCDDKKPHAEVRFWKRPKEPNVESPFVLVSPEHEAYYWLIRMGMLLAWRDGAYSIADITPILKSLLVSTHARIPLNKIKVVNWGYA